MRNGRISLCGSSSVQHIAMSAAVSEAEPLLPCAQWSLSRCLMQDHPGKTPHRNSATKPFEQKYHHAELKPQQVQNKTMSKKHWHRSCLFLLLFKPEKKLVQKQGTRTESAEQGPRTLEKPLTNGDSTESTEPTEEERTTLLKTKSWYMCRGPERRGLDFRRHVTLDGTDFRRTPWAWHLTIKTRSSCHRS